MVINFKVISKMIKLKVMENTMVSKVNNMKVNGRTVYWMVKDNKNGLIKVIILESLKKVRNMDKVNTFGMMDLIMKVNGIKERFMVKVFIFGSMVVNMMENLLMALDKVLVK